MKRQFHAENANRIDIPRMAAVRQNPQPEKDLSLGPGQFQSEAEAESRHNLARMSSSWEAISGT